MHYRVVDARGSTIQGEHEVTATSPEAAAKAALGIDLVRSGRRNDLVARIYWQERGNPTTMVRLYSRTAHAI
jgi:hypothetical protein